jgi:aldose 1-epimerase
VDDKHCIGCVVGRVTNRIKNGNFELDGITYQLEKNDGGKHHLHGVFSKRVWTSSIEHPNAVVFRYQSPDGIAHVWLDSIKSVFLY